MRWFFLAAVAFSLGACALQSPLEPDAAPHLRGRRLTTMVRRAPSFNLAFPGTFQLALSGPIGISEFVARTVDENQIVDPAPTIAVELSAGLERRYALRTSPILLAAVVDDDPTKVVLLEPKADLVLDVWTQGWGTRDESQRYVVSYAVNLRLIDAKVAHSIDGKSGAVIAEGTCTRSSESPAHGLPYDELMADHARLLKEELHAAARFCAKDMGSKILGLGRTAEHEVTVARAKR